MIAAKKPTKLNLFTVIVALLSAICGILLGILLTRFHYQQQSLLSPPQPQLQQQTNPSKSSSSSSSSSSLSSSSSQPKSIPLQSISPNQQCTQLIEQYTAGNRSFASKRLNDRAAIPLLLNELGLLGQAVEVGVRDGEHSHHILKNWKGQMLHMVDPWEHQDTSVYKDVSNRDQGGQDELFRQVQHLMTSKFPNRHRLHRGYSVPVAKELHDKQPEGRKEMFDFIYLDARHDYDGIKEDLNAWWPLLKTGGLYAGHDFVEDGENTAGFFGVQKAVKEFCDQHQREVMSISTKGLHGGRREPRQAVDGGWTTWYFFK